MEKQQMKAIVMKYRDQLGEPDATLYDILGFEGLCGLSELFGGGSLYIKKPVSLFAKCMQRSLMEEFNGANQRDLSAKYGMSARTVYNLAAKKRRVKKQ